MSLALRYRDIPGEPTIRYRGPEGRITAVSRRSSAPSIAAVIGPQGPGGSGARYEHIQSVASALWTVNHNLGVRPVAVSVLSPGGVEVDAAVTHVSDNQLTVEFSIPYTGTCIVTS